ncbi:MAG: Gfo/Idh/MocA family oxidoreductase [Candidatus Hydrogenedentes bacterium]|nr:Gfo/Idh/MocA family oxidoreductase [Candidatus Hydrogenedentota bacterium]MBI3117520.1 Gfo/Idh/MocA family oxidoreductase [Candidatus Hydrogenedentota bacterium]
MNQSISRRTFIQQVTAAGVAGPLVLPRLSLAAPPSSRLQHAAIGVGGQGAGDLDAIASSGKVDVIALCDVDALTLEKAAARYPGARLYRDWREMLEQEEKHIDSVNVSTPDHTHAPASMTAIRKGKHVFCEKPLTHEVYEARRITLAARKKGVATQMGIQIHSHDAYRTAVQWLQEGAIGKVREWHSWCGAVYTTDDKKRPEGSDPVPPNLDWDLWLGVAPERPYKGKNAKGEETYHPFWWRRWRDFGGGTLGDFGCHIFDPIFTALGIGAPLTVSVEPESVSDEVWPGWIIAEYLFPGTPLTAGKTIRATWRDSGKVPPIEFSPHLPKDRALPGSGSMVIGEEGTLLIPHVAAPHLYPEEKFKDYPQPALEPKNHYHEFVEAALGNGVPGANFDFSGPLAEAVLLGNVAGRFPGKTLEWNAKRLRITNLREANKFLRRDYREGWNIKGL